MIYTKTEMENVEVEGLDEAIRQILEQRCSSYRVEDYSEFAKKVEVLTWRGHTVITGTDALHALDILTNGYPVYLQDGTPGWMVREIYRGTNIYDDSFKFLGMVEEFEGRERRPTKEECGLKWALIDAPNIFAGVAPLKEYLRAI